MKISELIKKLQDAYKKLENNEDKYIVTENVEPGRGVNTYRFVFVAKKKKKKGLLGAIVSIAKEAALYGTSGIAYGITDEISRRMIQNEINLEPINKELLGKEVAMIFERWIKTIPKGYIETIGNNLKLPKDERLISAKIDPKKEIRIVIENVSLWTGQEQEVAPQAPPQQQTPPQPQPQPQPQIQAQPVTVPVPTTIPVPSLDFSRLYVKGSLASAGNEVSFSIMNPLGPVTLIAPFQVTIDGKRIPGDAIIIESSQGTRNNNTISQNNPLFVPVGDQIRFRIKNMKLSAGTHNISIVVYPSGMPSFVIAASDSI